MCWPKFEIDNFLDKHLENAKNLSNGVPPFSSVEISINGACNRRCIFCPRVVKEDYPNKFKAKPNSTKLIWPLKSTDSSQFHYDAVSMYMDHDITIGSVKDYNCGNQSYDLKDGYNHSGTDIMLWPYSWNMMDTESINVIASAIA